MPEFVIDAAMGAKLVSLGDNVVVKNASGRIIGRFIREEDPAEYEIPADHGLSPEELARRLAPDAKTFSTAEVLAHLRSLK